MFRITRKDLNEMVSRASQADPDGELSSTYYEEQLNKQNYVVHARNVPCPLDSVEAGAVVACTYDGMSAKWLNGTIYVRRSTLEK